MMTINTTSVSPQNVNGYKQKPNAWPTSKEQASFSLPAAAVGVGLAGGVPIGTYLMNRYEYQSGEHGYATGTKHEFFTQPDGQLQVRTLDSKGDILNQFRFDEKGRLRFSEQGRVKINDAYCQTVEKFDEKGKRIEGYLRTPSFGFETGKAFNGEKTTTGKTHFKIKEMEVEGKTLWVIDPSTLGENQDKVLNELKPITLVDNVELDGVKYMAIQGPAATAQERLKQLPKDIPTQFKDVEKYLKDLQVKRSLIGLGIGTSLGVLAYLGVTQLTKPKTEKPS